MNKLWMILLVFTTGMAVAKVEWRPVEQWYPCYRNQLMCTPQPSQCIIESRREIGIYNQSGELLMVTRPHQPDTLHAAVSGTDIAIPVAHTSHVKVLRKAFFDDKNESKVHLAPVYRQSLMLLLYLVVIIGFALTTPHLIDVIHPFHFGASYVGRLQQVVLAAFTSFMIGWMLDETNGWWVSLAIFALFCFKLAVGFFLDAVDRKDVFILPLFKVVNLLFFAYLSVSLMGWGHLDTAVVYDGLWYVLIVYFMVYGLRDAFLRLKNAHLSYIFCYICALEILPVLLLKEYVVI